MTSTTLVGDSGEGTRTKLKNDEVCEEEKKIVNVIEELTKEVPKPSEDPYTEVVELLKTDPVSLFQKRNYKVRLTIGEKAQVVHPVSAVIETGAGPNLIRRENFPSPWTNRIRSVKEPGLTGASKYNIILGGVILLQNKTRRPSFQRLVWCRQSSGRTITPRD